MSSYKGIKLEKGMYSVAGKTFTKVLEEMDPSFQYKNTEMEKLDAYQRQLKRYDIKISGKYSDSVSKFFTSSNTAALFPEYVSRAVLAGILETTCLDKIVATTTYTSSMDYRSLTSIPSDKTTFDIVGEGAKVPETYIKTQGNLVRLNKKGRMLVTSYEAIQNQRLDLFNVTLKQIGSEIAKSQMADAVNVLANGDGNNNKAQVISCATSGTLTYKDLLELWSLFDSYQMNTMLASPDMVLKMAELAEFQNPLTGLNFAGTGMLSTPIGAGLIKSGSIESGTIIGFDNNCAMEMVQYGDIQVEYDKLIDRQLERAAITSVFGFSKIFNDASKVLKS